VQTWIPAIPQVEERLRTGGSAADVGCGQGLASLEMAKALPKSRFWGFDPHLPSIERARANAKAQGLADRVTFETIDGVDLPKRRFDLIATFDVLHDSANPSAIVRAVRMVAMVFTVLPLTFVFHGTTNTFVLIPDAPIIGITWWVTAAHETPCAC
jgi:2-polyprenyl-3-methyl-5-hydroxy-6-metoxy-1,4-benzoquinol methylase